MSIFFSVPVEQYPPYSVADAAGISSTNVDANFPASNLLTYDPTQVMKSTATTGTSSVITWNMGGGLHRFFDVISFQFTNCSYRATLLLEESDGGTVWSTLYNGPLWANLVGAQPSSPTGPGTDTDERRQGLRRNSSLWVRSAGAIPGRTHIRATINDPVIGGFTIGRLFVGKKFAPTTGWQYGSSFSFADTSRKERTDRGALIMEASDTIVSASVKMEFLTKTEMYDYIYEFNYWRGSGREFLACLDVEDVPRLQKNLLYCTISEGRTVTFDAFNTHSQTWILESIA